MKFNKKIFFEKKNLNKVAASSFFNSVWAVNMHHFGGNSPRQSLDN